MNPKDLVGSKKARWFTYLPLQALVGPGLAFFEGGWKYGKHNYRETRILGSVYLDAAVSGHLMPYQEGENLDPDTGLHHIDKAIACLLIIRDAEINGNLVDDRPIKIKNPNIFKESHALLKQLTERLQARYPNPVTPFTEK